MNKPGQNKDKDDKTDRIERKRINRSKDDLKKNESGLNYLIKIKPGPNQHKTPVKTFLHKDKTFSEKTQIGRHHF